MLESCLLKYFVATTNFCCNDSFPVGLRIVFSGKAPSDSMFILNPVQFHFKTSVFLSSSNF